MAITLKNINSSINSGNEEVKELNENFNKWFELQKRNRLDELEDRREMKRTLKTSAGAGVGGKEASKDKKLDWKFLLPFLALPFLGGGDDPIVAPGTNKVVNKGTARRPSAKNANNIRQLRAANLAASEIAKLQQQIDKLKIDRLKAQLLAEQKAAAQEKSRLKRLGSAIMEYGKSRLLGNAFEAEKLKKDRLRREKVSRVRLASKFSGFGEVFSGRAPKISPFAELGSGVKSSSSGVMGGLRAYEPPGFIRSKAGKLWALESPQGKLIQRFRLLGNQSTSTRRPSSSNAQAIKAMRTAAKVSIPKSVSGQMGPNAGRFKGSTALTAVSNTLKKFGGSITSGFMGETSGRLLSSKGGVNIKLRAQGPPAATGNFKTDIQNLLDYKRSLVPAKIIKYITLFTTKAVLPLMGVMLAFDIFKTLTSDIPMSEKIIYMGGQFAGVAGGVIGAQIGAIIGTMLIPVPGFGSLAGGLLGGFVGYLKGQQLGEFCCRYLFSLAQPENIKTGLQAALLKWKGEKLTNDANRMVGLNSSTQQELGSYGTLMADMNAPTYTSAHGAAAAGLLKEQMARRGTTGQMGANAGKFQGFTLPHQGSGANFGLLPSGSTTAALNLQAIAAMESTPTMGRGRNGAAPAVIDLSTTQGDSNTISTIISGNNGQNNLDQDIDNKSFSVFGWTPFNWKD
jgi:hypothetical protein